MNIKEISKEIYENNVAHGFWTTRECGICSFVRERPLPECRACGGTGKIVVPQDRNVGEMLMLITSELGEALEAHRKGRYNFITSYNTEPPDIEEWVDVVGYEGEYEVSNLGRVRSLDRVINNGKNYYSKEGRILKAGLGGDGYYTVSLSGKTYKVARLVGKAFCEGYSDNKVINHINGNKTDDYSSNLEWITSSENNSHAISTGLRNVHKILSYEDTVEIAFLCKSGISHKEIHEQFPQVSLSRIKAISKNKEIYTESFEFELADAAIRLFDVAYGLGIDLEAHIAAKHRYNKTRPYKHGKAY